MTEKAFQTQIVAIARLNGWLCYHTHDSRKCAPGFPDLVLVHPREHALTFAELKTASGRLTSDQETWIAALAHTAGEIYVWRPADLGMIKDRLSRRYKNGSKS